MTHTQSEDTMTSEWKTVKLGEIAQINPTETLKKGTTAKKVAMENLRPYCRDIPEYELSEYNGGAKFRNGDTIMARITPCLENGKIAKVGILDEGEVGFGSTEFIVFRANEGYDEDFVYYLVYSSDVKAPAIKSMVGSSGRQRVQTDVVQNLQLRVPPLDVQRKIAAVLKPLDDKIELNARINARLERVTQALFKRHFVRFEPYGGTMPPGWRVGTLSEIAHITSGKRPPVKSQESTEKMNIPLVGAASVMGFTNVANHTDKILIIGRVGTHGVVQRFNSPCWASDNTLIITSGFYEYVYQQLHLIDYSNLNRGSTQPLITQGDMNKIKLLIPTEDALNEYEELAGTLMRLVEHNTDESRTLARLRDVLLPRLMSGAVDVRQVNLNSIQKGGSR